MKKNIQNQIGWLLQEKYKGKLTNSAKQDIEKLAKREPLDYLIGFINFLDCKIDLSKKPLIPRIETEYWVDKLINEDFKLQKSNFKVLDMFAGSGAIGISIMRHIKNSKVVFSDSEVNCINQIKINCQINKIPKNRYKIIKSDVFENIIGKFNYIVANPPYISTKRIKKIQKSVLKYEPHVALFGGKDGLLYINKFLVEAKSFLNKNGSSLPVRRPANGVRASKIYMEFDSIQKKQIEKLLKKLNYQNYQFQKDQYDKWRSLIIII